MNEENKCDCGPECMCGETCSCGEGGCKCDESCDCGCDHKSEEEEVVE